MNIHRSHRDNQKIRRTFVLKECTSRRVCIWTGRKCVLCVWVCIVFRKFKDREMSFGYFTYFIACTVAIIFIVALWTVFGIIADSQLRDTCTRFACELFGCACYLCVYIYFQLWRSYDYLHHQHMRDAMK